jgi:hypothetical protein
MNSITPRPEFHGPDDFVEHVAMCLASGYEPFDPATIAELHAALERWPEYARRWLPNAAECSKLGIDPTIGQAVEPLSEREQERSLVTLAKDCDFRLAFRSLLFGGKAA